MDEIVKEFLVESYENLDHLDSALVELEKDPRHKESWNSIFRTVHTLKGTCGYLGAGGLARICRELERLTTTGPVTAGLPLLDELEAEFGRVRAALERELGEGAR